MILSSSPLSKHQNTVVVPWPHTYMCIVNTTANNEYGTRQGHCLHFSWRSRLRLPSRHNNPIPVELHNNHQFVPASPTTVEPRKRLHSLQSSPSIILLLHYIFQVVSSSHDVLVHLTSGLIAATNTSTISQQPISLTNFNYEPRRFGRNDVNYNDDFQPPPHPLTSDLPPHMGTLQIHHHHLHQPHLYHSLLSHQRYPSHRLSHLNDDASSSFDCLPL